MDDIRTLAAFIVSRKAMDRWAIFAQPGGLVETPTFPHFATLPDAIPCEGLAVKTLSCTVAPGMIQTMYSIRLGGSNFMQSG
jgi:hypothetical protein